MPGGDAAAPGASLLGSMRACVRAFAGWAHLQGRRIFLRQCSKEPFVGGTQRRQSQAAVRDGRTTTGAAAAVGAQQHQVHKQAAGRDGR